MDEQEAFFSPNHNRVLDIATWAKYLAWVALAFFVLRVGLTILNDWLNFQYVRGAPGFSATGYSYWQMIQDKPMYYVIETVPYLLSYLLQGAVYYVVLKGISLGLNMIVETDINYREAKNEGGRQ